VRERGQHQDTAKKMESQLLAWWKDFTKQNGLGKLQMNSKTGDEYKLNDIN
jgi:hypothetical protein